MPEWMRVTGNFRHDMREVLTVAFKGICSREFVFSLVFGEAA